MTRLASRMPLLLAAWLLACAAAPAADLTVRVDARDVQRKHIHTDMSLAVHGER